MVRPWICAGELAMAWEMALARLLAAVQAIWSEAQATWSAFGRAASCDEVLPRDGSSAGDADVLRRGLGSRQDGGRAVDIDA